jgi:4-hydroxy-tetrahydrodipicolinate synthase|tara:strand:+ start:143 stop:1012 length:870 start_codon:yes stop_codon:yes gene_type:complete
MSKFTGTGVALITPFKEDKSIDYKSFENLITYNISGGVDFFVILGTTSESPCLSFSEKQEIIDFTIKETNSKVPIMVGITGNNTTSVVNEILELDLSNIQGILSATPYYNKPSQEGLYLHYAELSKISPLPIVLYNVPSRTGVNMLASTCLRLATDFNNIIAVKEASGDMQQIQDILDNKPSSFNVLSGDDPLTVEMILSGANGVISVIAQAYPNEFSSMVNFSLKHDKDNAWLIHNSLKKLYSPLYDEGNPSGIKALLYNLNLCRNILRLPLTPISSNLMKSLKLLLK